MFLKLTLIVKPLEIFQSYSSSTQELVFCGYINENTKSLRKIRLLFHFCKDKEWFTCGLIVSMVIHKSQVLKWFEKNPYFHKQPKVGQSQFLQNKSQVLASLVSVQTKGDFVNQLEDILLQIKCQEPMSSASKCWWRSWC